MTAGLLVLIFCVLFTTSCYGLTVGSQDAMRSVAVQADRKAVAAGFSITSGGVNQFLIARYTTGWYS